MGQRGCVGRYCGVVNARGATARAVEENLRKFEDMRRGMYNEGEVCLRMKMDVKNENYNMFDLIAYRIKYMPHPMVSRSAGSYVA